ncbi:MAG TPA: Fic family protein [Candidatus Nanoarchaeia archaeon]|nr:Fic family protein [Candidatus Nanoarchaeia archaeon]
MVYTEIKEKNGKKYYYRVHNVREKNKFRKKRVYLGVDLERKKLKDKEETADKELSILSSLLTKEEVSALNHIKESYQKESKVSLENRYESFVSLFTYDSTAIEGNTLSLEETSFLLFEKIVPKSKSLREINETLNHKKAFDKMLSHKGDLTKAFIRELHKLVVENTLREELNSQVGSYRNVQVFIRGRDWMPPKPEEVSNEMKTLLSWYSKNRKKLHPLIVASYFHVAFETIHPFVDGNGRVGRLLMNFILHKNNYPMINIPSKTKFDYYNALNKATIDGDLRPFIELMIKLLQDSKVRF